MGHIQITNATHTLREIDNRYDLYLYEITLDEGEQIDRRFYVTQKRDGQVFSVIPDDMPSSGGTWFSRVSPAGVAYVAGGRTRATARRWFKKLADEQSMVLGDMEWGK